MNLNNQAKVNDIYKESLHSTLREYLSWKNALFKQNITQPAQEPQLVKLFTNPNGKKFSGNNYLDYGKLNPEEIINDMKEREEQGEEIV